MTHSVALSRPCMQPDAMTAARSHAAGPGYGAYTPLELDQRTWIVAPGPNGRDRAMSLHPNTCAIAVNRAGVLRPWRYWLCISANAYRQPWYDAIPASTVKIMGLHARDGRANYIMQPEDCPPGTSVTGAALALCRAAGVKQVILCGVDMPESYPHRDALQALIESCAADMQVYTASPTRLDIPAWS